MESIIITLERFYHLQPGNVNDTSKKLRYYGTLFIFFNNCGSFRVFRSMISYQYISWGTQLHVTSFACFQVFQTHAMGPRQIKIYFKFFYIADIIRRCLVLLYSKQGRHHITQCFHLVGRSWFSFKKKVGICFNVQMLIHNKIYRVNISQITGFTAKSNATLPNIIKQNDNW